MSRKRSTMESMVGSRDAGSIRGSDYYSTPPEATRALLGVEDFEGPIWEPAAGNGAIVRVLREAGHEVIATDLNPHGEGQAGVDFLMECDLLAPNIVTNPPYKLANLFAKHAIDLGASKYCVLMRLAWLEGSARRKLFERTKLSRVWVFSARLPRMHREGYEGKKTSSLIAFAWFVWDDAHKGAPRLGWVDHRDAPYDAKANASRCYDLAIATLAKKATP